MLKILLIAPTFAVSKNSKVQAMMSAYKSALNLSKHAHVIVLAAGDAPRYERMNKNLEVYRLKSIYLGDPINYMMPLSIFWQTIRLTLKEKPDVFLVNKFMFFNAMVIPLLKIMGKGQRIYTQIDAFPSIDWISRTTWIRPLMWLYMRLIGLPLLWMSKTVILFHEGMVPIAKRFHLKHRVIHNGVDFEEFDHAKMAKDVVKKNPNDVHIAFVGRLESMKGYDVLLNIAKKLLPDYPHAKLFMVGGGRHKEAIMSEYQNDQIRFLGVRDDIPALLKGIDIFVLPSFSEGLSNALMEAMAAGCACITMNTQGGNRILIQPGVTGLLAELNNPASLEAQIKKCIENSALRKKLGANASKLIREKFNWETISREYLNLFKEVHA